MGAAAHTHGGRLLILSAMAYLVLAPALQPALLSVARPRPWNLSAVPRPGIPAVTS